MVRIDSGKVGRGVQCGGPQRRKMGRRRGQMLPLVSVLLVILLAMSGLVLDGGRMYFEKRRMQNAADAGALAGAHELYRGNTDLGADVRPAAVNDTGLNGYTDGDSSITVNLINGPTGLANRAVEVTIARTVPTTLIQVLNAGPVTVRARGTAGLAPYIDACIIALSPSAAAALKFHGNAVVDARCGLVSNSQAGNGFERDGGAVVSSTFSGVAGYYSDNGGSGSISPAPEEQAPPMLDPLAFLEPPDYTGWPMASFNPATNEYACPGGQCVFNKKLTVAGSPATKTFQPGIYVLRQGMDIVSNITVEGFGVTFYNASTKFGITIGGSSTVTFEAPTSGPYKGILFYANPDSGDFNNMLGVGDAVFNFRGAIYLPSQSVMLEGTTIGAAPFGMVIAQTVDIGGGANLTMSGTTATDVPAITKVTLLN